MAAELHINHQFCLDEARKANGKILEVGCGHGELVTLGREETLDIWGVDNFSCSPRPQKLPVGVRPTTRSGAFPFPDATFDFIFSNQTFEHVAELDRTLRELRRVIKPTGTMLHLFPSREVWREGHCGVPFAHRINRRSYLYASRVVGFGLHTSDLAVSEWAVHQHHYLQTKCFYRSKIELLIAFTAAGFTVEPDEHAYMLYRAAHNVPWLRHWVQRSNGFASWIFEKLAFMVWRCQIA